MAFDYEYSPSRDRGSCSTIIVGKDASDTGYAADRYCQPGKIK